MKTLISILFLLSNFNWLMAQHHTLYLIPGTGGDHRLFKNLQIENCETSHIELWLFEKGETLPEYAQRLSAQIDTTQPYSIAGVSLGGMVAVEMAKFIQPEKVFLISSAKTKSELPLGYQLQKHIPIYKLFSGNFYKKITNFGRAIWEPECKPENELCNQMVNDKHPDFIPRAIDAIVNWKNETVPENVIHIHGDNDHTLPFHRINNPIRIKNGSHMMVLIHAHEISEMINDELKEYNEQ
ncbi:alpha/beta hydrolase [Bacteroidales bacterium AH-315-I05]|nr:alpha/beta hydrolase [Bacteroidales bacterium AH-315-I05]